MLSVLVVAEGGDDTHTTPNTPNTQSCLGPPGTNISVNTAGKYSVLSGVVQEHSKLYDFALQLPRCFQYSASL